MGRARRVTTGGLVYHVLNRGNGRSTIFEKPDDYAAFERILAEAVEQFGTRILTYCLMPNHWHLALWPRDDGELSMFMKWVVLTHTQRWHAHRGTAGLGHVYQGRFKSFPVEHDDHCLIMLRYVERNALRARLVERAEDWTWCGLHHWLRRDDAHRLILSPWPIERPHNWVTLVNTPLTQPEESAIRRSIDRGQPFGSERWLDGLRLSGVRLPDWRERGRPHKVR